MLHSTAQIATECKVSVWLVGRYLRDHGQRLKIDHYQGEWWKLTDEQYEAVCDTLKSAKAACPKQPRHALQQAQGFICFSWE